MSTRRSAPTREREVARPPQRGFTLNRPSELESWLSFFRARRGRPIDLPWSEDVPLDEATRNRIARSIATFQLGESSDGRHLLSAARRFGARHGLPALAEITELFIREEQFHAALLAAFMKQRGIPILRSQWSDRVFRSLRHVGGFEVAISVLLVAEIIALTYYRALAEATPSSVLRYISSTIVSDEEAHVSYEASLLAGLQLKRSWVARRCAHLLHGLLYAGALVVVYSGHRGVLRAGGYEFRHFWKAGWSRFLKYLGSESAPRTSAVAAQHRAAPAERRGTAAVAREV